MASSDEPSAGSPPPGRGSLYGGLPDAGAPGLAPQLIRFCDELRREGVKLGSAEILDAFGALDEVSWTAREDFREALAATLAKSQEDRRVFELVFDRFFFRSAEAEALHREVREDGGVGGEEGADAAAAEIDLEALRARIAQALRDGAEGPMRDLAQIGRAHV